MRILLIEDEQLIREQLHERHTQHGYVVDSAADGEEGLFLGQEYPYDAAVIDLGCRRWTASTSSRHCAPSRRIFPS